MCYVYSAKEKKSHAVRGDVELAGSRHQVEASTDERSREPRRHVKHTFFTHIHIFYLITLIIKVVGSRRHESPERSAAARRESFPDGDGPPVASSPLTTRLNDGLIFLRSGKCVLRAARRGKASRTRQLASLGELRRRRVVRFQSLRPRRGHPAE